jgi:hypothetical protein
VDGLDTWQPLDEELYRQRGRKTAKEGYITMSQEYLPHESRLSTHSITNGSEEPKDAAHCTA